MNARQAASQLSFREFQAVCSIVDDAYQIKIVRQQVGMGSEAPYSVAPPLPAIRFEVLRVERTLDHLHVYVTTRGHGKARPNWFEFVDITEYRTDQHDLTEVEVAA